MRIFSPDVLWAYCKNVLTASGVEEGCAQAVADVLIDADLTGVSTHGVSRMSIYMQRMEAGLGTGLFQQKEDGVELSGGEGQKLAIARALYKDAPVVILDEPTAALDPVSEYEIYSRFGRLVEGKTSVYISHRMSSCRFCDVVFVFDGGTIVQQGSHEALLAQDGLYSRLWQAQAQYY